MIKHPHNKPLETCILLRLEAQAGPILQLAGDFSAFLVNMRQHIWPNESDGI